MPGITGIISRNHNEDRSDMLRSMHATMKHESFYTSGTFIDKSHGVYIGYVTIQNSFSDCMPIFNENRSIVMFFYGECFFDDTVKNSFLRNKTHINASALMSSYEKKGSQFISDLNGWFSGVIIDLKKSEIILFNDRYGMQRLYFHESKDDIFFSSEAKSLLKILPSLRYIDFQSIAEYISFDCVLNNRTFFSDIFLVPNGSIWRYTQGQLIKNQYFFTEEWENQRSLHAIDFWRELEDTFKRIIGRYFTEKSIGLALTGGIDTRMILALLNPQPGSLPCFTFGGIYRDSLDVRIARQVAHTCRQMHDTINLRKSFLDDFPYWANQAVYITDGLCNVTICDELYLNKKLREYIPIKVTGKFGSQILRGVRGLRNRLPDKQLINCEFDKHIKHATATFTELLKKNELSFFLFNEIPWYWAGFASAELSQLSPRSPYLDNEITKLLYRYPAVVFDNPNFQSNFIKKCNPNLMSIMTNRGEGGSESQLICISQKLIYRFLSTADQIYTWDKIPFSLTHWVARLDQKLSFLNADKMIRGFGYFRHYRTWFRDELSPYIQEVLLDSRTLQRPYWNKSFLKKMVSDHINGHRNYLNEIKKVLTIELIHRTLIENR